MLKVKSDIDNYLLHEAAKGNEAAFRNLYNKWQPPLSGFIFRITKSKELTAEIVQDVFLKLWINRHNLAEVENFKSYLYVVCRNHALNVFRKAMKEIRYHHQLDNAVFKEYPYESGDADVSDTDIIDQAIDQLPPRQREVYLLHRHERLTYQQIAEKLGIGRETVKTHLELAVKSMTTFLKSRATLFMLVSEFFSENL